MKWLQVLQVIIAFVLIIAILLQNKGGGLSDFLGGNSNVYMAKRGMEKTLFTITIILAVLFLSISLASAIYVN